MTAATDEQLREFFSSQKGRAGRSYCRLCDSEIRHSTRAPQPGPAPDGSLIAVLADLHLGEEDRHALGAVEQWLVDVRPAAVVLAGDVGEFQSCNSRPGPRPEYAEDIARVQKWLAWLRAALPMSRIVYLEGNHETRFARLEAGATPSTAGVHSLPEDLGLEALRIEWLDEGSQPLALGDVDVLHGHQAFGSMPPKHCAAKVADVYGAASRTVLFAHCHRRQLFERAMAGGNAVAVSLPCLRELHPSWLSGREAGWSHGFAVVNVASPRSTVELVEIRDGRFCWGGRWWGA